MKNKQLTTVLLLLLLAPMLHAQITRAKPEEFKEIKSRTLIVEMLEEDKEVIKDLEKELSKAKNPEDKDKAQKNIDAYKNFVTDYNTLSKEAVTKYWGLNPKVDYKTTTEVKKLRKAKSKAYTVLFYSESSSSASDAQGFRYFPDMAIPTLNYSRIEEGTVGVDYSFFIPYTNQRPAANKLRLADLIISLKIMKNQIAEIEKLGKKGYTTKEFIEDQAKANDKSVRSKKLYMDKGLIHKKTSEHEIKESYKGDITFLSSDEIANMIETEKEGLISIAIPSTIRVASGGLVTVGRIEYYRAFVDAKTGVAYTCKGTSLGELIEPHYRSKEFSGYGK